MRPHLKYDNLSYQICMKVVKRNRFNQKINVWKVMFDLTCQIFHSES